MQLDHSKILYQIIYSFCYLRWLPCPPHLCKVGILTPAPMVAPPMMSDVQNRWATEHGLAESPRVYRRYIDIADIMGVKYRRDIDTGKVFIDPALASRPMYGEWPATAQTRDLRGKTNVFLHPPLNCEKFPSPTFLLHRHFPLQHSSLTIYILSCNFPCNLFHNNISASDSNVLEFVRHINVVIIIIVVDSALYVRFLQIKRS